MQRIFNNKHNKSVFNDKSITYETILGLIEYFSTKNDDVSADIANLLIITNNFMSKTAPRYQKERDSRITEQQVNNILDVPGRALKDFNLKYKNGSALANDAFEFCEQAILNQLELLKSNGDRIYLHYKQCDNLLKNQLKEYRLLLKNNRII